MNGWMNVEIQEKKREHKKPDVGVLLYTMGFV